MMNKKLVALLVTILTVSTSMFAYHEEECWTDRYGDTQCRKRGHFFPRDRKCIDGDCYEGPVENVTEGTRDVVSGAVEVGTLGLVRP